MVVPSLSEHSPLRPHSFLSFHKAVTMLYFAEAEDAKSQSDDALPSSPGSRCSLTPSTESQTLVLSVIQYVRPDTA